MTTDGGVLCHGFTLGVLVRGDSTMEEKGFRAQGTLIETSGRKSTLTDPITLFGPVPRFGLDKCPPVSNFPDITRPR